MRRSDDLLFVIAPIAVVGMVYIVDILLLTHTITNTGVKVART